MKTAHKAFALVLIFLLAFPAPLFAWDSLGHMAVAYVAYQHLNPATKTRINNLLKLNPNYRSSSQDALLLRGLRLPEVRKKGGAVWLECHVQEMRAAWCSVDIRMY